MAKWIRVCVLVLLGSSNLAQLQAVTVKGRVVVFSSAKSKKQAAYSGVVIWLTPVLKPVERPVRTTSLDSRPHFRLAQKNKHFDPHLLVVPAGSSVEFPNLDPFFHNVFSLFEGKRFDLGLYESGTTRATVFDRPGICYIFCNIHPEMSAVIVVVDTPYFGVTNSEGEVAIRGVPAGRYQLCLWHERSAPETLRGLAHDVAVTEDNGNLDTIHLTESGELAVAHKNKYGRDYDEPRPSTPGYEPDE